MSATPKTTNIILANLSEAQLRVVLELCKIQNIHYTFDKDYYSEEEYDVGSILEQVLLNNNKVPIVYKDLMEGQFKDVAKDSDETEILEKLENIQYDDVALPPAKKPRASRKKASASDTKIKKPRAPRKKATPQETASESASETKVKKPRAPRKKAEEGNTNKVNKRLQALKDEYELLKSQYINGETNRIYHVLENVAKKKYYKDTECAEFQEEFFQDFMKNTCAWNGSMQTDNFKLEEKLMKLREKKAEK